MPIQESTAHDKLFDEYCRVLAEAAPALGADGSDPKLWTRVATTSLVRVAYFAFPKAKAAAKGFPDQYDRQEYKGHDVTLWDAATWGPPLFVAEHDNSGQSARVQYDAWKLLTTESAERVLVAYYGDGTDMLTFEDLAGAVKRVASDNPGRRLLLIGAKYFGTDVDLASLRASHKYTTFA
jgi:hypothetical protein